MQVSVHNPDSGAKHGFVATNVYALLAVCYCRNSSRRVSVLHLICESLVKESEKFCQISSLNWLI